MNKDISLTGLICATVFTVLFALIPVRAEAATIKTYTEGKVVRAQLPEEVLYKYTLTEDSLIEINYAYNNSDEGGVLIYQEGDFLNSVEKQFFFNESGKVFTALNAGTYYIDFFEDCGNRTIKVKMTVTPASKYSKGNYCKAKAVSLEQRKWEKLVQTRHYEYSRWYVIKVPKTQKVSIDMPSGNSDETYLFNSKCSKRYSTNYDGRTQVTKNRVQAGTYYIAIHPFNVSTYNMRRGVFYQFRWY